MAERFEGEVTVRSIRYANEASGWAVLDTAASDGAPVVLVGPLVHLEARERAHVSGTWVDDSRYGRQVKVDQARPLAPEDPEVLAAYLRRVKHVGAKRAARLVQRFGSRAVLEEIDRDPEGAFATAGLSAARAREAAAAWQGLRATRRLHLLLAPHGLAYLAPRLLENYGERAHETVLADPYELTGVFGVGFSIADRIARSLGEPVDGRLRARAAVVHALGEAERSGSTCLPREALLAQAGELLGEPVDPATVTELVGAGRLVEEEGWIYRAQTAELEAELAERVARLSRGRPGARFAHAGERAGAGDPVRPSAAGAADRPGAPARASPAEDEAALTDEQRGALENALTHRLSLITGGPGTGKTASIRSIARAAAELGARVMLVAPTGRAAVRMAEASGLRARTVHSALGWVPGEGPAHDEHEPLDCDLLIADECSMANLELLVALLRAVGDGCHAVLVGDADQLAPVGAGKPFAELVASGRVATTRLTRIFRQAAGSMIVQAAHAIRRGAMPELAPGPGMRRDLFLIERSSAARAREEIVSLVCERLPAHYGVDPARDIQVFAPVYRGELGIDALNAALREVLNPDGRPVRSGRLRIGDKLVMTGRNLHDLGLMNGTLLRLVDEVEPGAGDDEEAALILTGEEGVFRLAPEEADGLRLAYACSVHRGQGIELPVAVIVAHPAAGAFFLRREMLYTALTRARLATVIVGLREVLARAVRTPDTERRHGRLGERLAALGAPARPAPGPGLAPGHRLEPEPAQGPV